MFQMSGTSGKLSQQTQHAMRLELTAVWCPGSALQLILSYKFCTGRYSSNVKVSLQLMEIIIEHFPVIDMSNSTFIFI